MFFLNNFDDVDGKNLSIALVDDCEKNDSFHNTRLQLK